MTASMSRRRATARAGAAATERSIVAELDRQRGEAAEATRAAREQHGMRRAIEGEFTAEDLTGAVAVQTAHHGWMRVLKVNRKTIAVDCMGYNLNASIDRVIGAACQWPRTQEVAS